jgi:hypothetical protein
MKIKVNIEWRWFMYVPTNFVCINFYVKIMNMAAEWNLEAMFNNFQVNGIYNEQL